MITIPPQLVLVLICTAVLLVTLILGIARDARAVRTSNTLNHLLITAGKRQAKRSFSIILHLDKRAETIIPLLDRLFSSGYQKLEVIVVIKQTAGKYARVRLVSYKKANKVKLRLITYRAGMNDTDITGRYAQSEFIVRLLPDMALSEDFFSKISFDYLLSRADAIIPRFYTRLDATIKKAIASYARTIRNSPFIDLSIIVPGVVYKRRSILKHPKVSTIFESQTAFILDDDLRPIKHEERYHLRPFRLIAVSLATIALFAYIATISPSEKVLVLGIYIGAFIFLYGGSLMGTKAYTTFEKISLILLSPLFLIYRVATYIAFLLRPLADILKRGSAKFALARKKHAQ